MTNITGNTFPHRAALRALAQATGVEGWNADAKVWQFPDDVARTAQAIVDRAAPPAQERGRAPYRGGGRASKANSSTVVMPRVETPRHARAVTPTEAASMTRLGNAARAILGGCSPAELAHHARTLATYVLQAPDVQAVWSCDPDVEAERAAYYAGLDAEADAQGAEAPF